MRKPKKPRSLEHAKKISESLKGKPTWNKGLKTGKNIKLYKPDLNLILNPKKQVSSTDIQDIDTLKQGLNEVKIQSAELQQSTQSNVA